MTSQGYRRRHHPLRWLGALGKQYPWSVLWVMFTAGLAAVASKAYVPVLIILILSCIIGLQAAHRERVAARKARSKDE